MFIMTENGWTPLFKAMAPAPLPPPLISAAASAKVVSDYNDLFLKKDGTDIRRIRDETGLSFTEQRKVR